MEVCDVLLDDKLLTEYKLSNPCDLNPTYASIMRFNQKYNVSKIIPPTSIVINRNNKQRGLKPFYYRNRTCVSNITSTPAEVTQQINTDKHINTAYRYQTLKKIQNSVRVHSSLYTDSKGCLSSYQINPTFRWNQQSDRHIPSVQKATVPTVHGLGCLSNTRYSVTSSRPGCQTPGGVGCDIKHNSYDRYLNRLKATGPLRRQPIPVTFQDKNIPFNRAYPIYGGKTVTTSIVAGCVCPKNYKPTFSIITGLN